MNRSRVTGDLTASGLLYADIANDRVGIGSTIPGNKLSLPDSAKIGLGNAEDLTLYHTGSHSYINNALGDLVLKTTNDDIVLEAYDDISMYVQGASGSGAEKAIMAIGNGAVELYHNNSKKLETTSTGAQIDTILTCYGAAGNPGRLRLQEGGALSEIMVARNSDTNSFLYFKTEIGGSTATRVVIDESGHFRPFADSTYDLGITGTRWRNVYADTLYGNGSNLTGIDTDLVSDTSPQLGGTLDVNGQVVSFDDASGVNVNRAKFGTDNDMHIYHNGSNSTIRHEGTGSLLLNTTTGSIQMLHNSENMLIAVPDGEVKLYHNNSKKLETTSWGMLHQGGAKADGTGYFKVNDSGNFYAGNDEDLQIFHDGTQSVITTNNLATKPLHIKGDPIWFYKTGSSELFCKMIADNAVELYFDGNKKFETLTDGVKITGELYLDDTSDIKIGTGQDLNIWHNGTSSGIDNKTGHLYIRNNYGGDVGGNIYIQALSGENSINCINDGAVELYHDNTWRLKTTSSGVETNGEVTCGNVNASGEFNMTGNGAKYLDFFTLAGNNTVTFRHHNPSGNGFETFATFTANNEATLSFDGVTKFRTKSHGFELPNGSGNNKILLYNSDFIQLGHSTDGLRIYNTSVNSIIDHTSGSGTLYLRGDALRLQTSQSTPEDYIVCSEGGYVQLYHHNQKVLETESNGIIVQGPEGGAGCIFLNADEADDHPDKWMIRSKTDGVFDITGYGSGDAWKRLITCTQQQGVHLYYNDTSRLNTSNSGIWVNGTIGAEGLAFGDNKKLILGAQLEIYHTGSQSIIKDGYGDFRLNATTIRFRDSANSYTSFQCQGNGATTLYYSSNPKLATDAAGVSITGRAAFTGGSSNATQSVYLSAGSNNETQMGMYNGYDKDQGFCFYNNGSTSNTSWGMITDQSKLYFKTAAYNIGNTSDLSSSWTTRVMIDGSGHIHSRSQSAQYIVLGSSGDSLGTISNNLNWIRSNGDNVQYNTAGGFHAWEVSGSQKMLLEEQNIFLRGADQCRIVLGNSGDGTYDHVGNDTNWMRSSGDNLEYNCCDNGQHRWEVGGAFVGNITRYGEWRLRAGSGGDGAVSSDCVHGIGNAALDNNTGNLARLVMQERTSHWISFKTGDGSHYGSIYKSGSNVVYGGTSDYRLKENVTPLTGAITTLKLLKPITYTWNDLSKFENTDTHRGFLAHEVQEVEPDAVSGTKDGMTYSGNCVNEAGETTQVNVQEFQKEDGETWTKTHEAIDIQQLDERKLIPILTAALQEAVTKIETLETKVATLESNA